MKRTIAALVPCVLVFLTGCKPSAEVGSTASPESTPADQHPSVYGVYVRDEGVLHRIDRPGESGRDGFSDKAVLVVFDRRLGSGTLNPVDMVSVAPMAKVRLNVEFQKIGGSKSPSQSFIERAVDDIVTLKERIPLDARPVAGQPEMVELLPVKGWQPGIYNVSSSRLEVRAVVGVKTAVNGDVPFRGIDREYQVSLEKGFEWENWSQEEQPHIGWDKANHSGRYPCEYQDTNITDERQVQAENGFGTWLDSLRFQECAQIIRMCRQSGRLDKALVEKLVDALMGQARLLRESSPEAASIMAWRVLQTQPDHAEAEKLVGEVKQQMEERNRAGKAKVDAWLAKHTTIDGEPLFFGKLVTEEVGIGVRERQEAAMKVTSYYLKADTEGGDLLQVWLPDILSVEKGNSWGLESAFPREKRRPYYTANIKCRIDTPQSKLKLGERRGPHLVSLLTGTPQLVELKFSSEKDRDTVADLITRRRQEMQADAPFTDGNVTVAIEQGRIKYVIKLDPYYWSPWVTMPALLSKVKFGGSQARCQIEGYDEEYTTLGDTLLSGGRLLGGTIKAAQRLKFVPDGSGLELIVEAEVQ
jgi:hypothetical protein